MELLEVRVRGDVPELSVGVPTVPLIPGDGTVLDQPLDVSPLAPVTGVTRRSPRPDDTQLARQFRSSSKRGTSGSRVAVRVHVTVIVPAKCTRAGVATLRTGQRRADEGADRRVRPLDDGPLSNPASPRCPS